MRKACVLVLLVALLQLAVAGVAGASENGNPGVSPNPVRPQNY